MAGIRAGNYAIGTGGDYPTWSAFLAAIDPFISGQIVGTQISDITETGVVSFDGKTFMEGVWNGVYCNPGLTFNSNSYHYGNPQNGWKTIFTGNGHHGFHIHSTGTNHISPTLNGLNIVSASGIISSGYALVYNTHANYTTMTVVSLHNCIINGNHNLVYGIHASGSYFENSCYNNIIINCNCAGIKLTDSGAEGGDAGIFINNSIALNNIGFWNDGDNYWDYFVLANAIIGNNVDYYCSPSKTGVFPSERNAFSDNSYTDNYPLSNFSNFTNISLNSVLSLDDTSNDFLRVASGTILANSGTLEHFGSTIYPYWNPLFPGIRGNSRPYASGLTSIGADEFSPSGSNPTSNSPTVFISKPSFCWGTTPVDIDIIYSENMSNFDLSKITVTNAIISDLGWLVGSSRRRLRLTPYGTANLSITVNINSAKSVATQAWANGYGPVAMSWYATDPTIQLLCHGMLLIPLFLKTRLIVLVFIPQVVLK